MARALRSVALQSGVEKVRVIVVDDASPIPACDELRRLAAPFPFRIDIIEQPNGGPGAARNRALDVFATSADYIAFLDSDDEWSAEHLTRACTALDQGYDVFFADLMQLGATVTAFRRASKIDPDRFPKIGGADGLHAYTGDMFDQIMRGNVIGTPTVVFNRARFPLIRFREEYRSAGEDYLFWMELAKAGARFAFSSQCEAVCGAGVNVYAGSGWGTETHFLRLHSEIRYRKSVNRLFAITEVQKKAIAEEIRRLQEAMIRDLAHRVHHHKGIPWSLLGVHVMLDPALLSALPRVCAKILTRK